ncbi:MAG: amidase family protein, partial [Planctomycetota bacterium]
MPRIVVAVTLALMLVACGEPADKTPAAPVFDPCLAPIDEIQVRLADGSLTSEELVTRCLARIEAYEKAGPALNALITINDRAVEQARFLDEERKAKGARGPLHGIPVILKDNYDTVDLPTTGGSAILAGSRPPDDAKAVSKLREAGVVILGKANMSEFALSYGWLGYGSAVGQTRNPHNTLRDPSGSSSGSAVAVAAGFAVLAVGTDTAGSVRGPACVCGVVGIKPTLGLVSRNGIIPASLTCDVAGPIARSVRGAAMMLAAMAGPDETDPMTRLSIGRTFDPAAAMKPRSLKGARLGVVRAWHGANADADEVFEAALAALKKRGAVLVEVKLPESLS